MPIILQWFMLLLGTLTEEVGLQNKDHGANISQQKTNKSRYN